jgi:hypothetical protein
MHAQKKNERRGNTHNKKKCASCGGNSECPIEILRKNEQNEWIFEAVAAPLSLTWISETPIKSPTAICGKC